MTSAPSKKRVSTAFLANSVPAGNRVLARSCESVDATPCFQFFFGKNLVPDIFIDFETRSRVDLRVSGVNRYARDPSTEVLCMAYAIEDGLVGLWKPGDMHPTMLLYAVAIGSLLHAHNAGFERAIWQHIMVERYDWPPIPLEHWRCTAAKAAYANHPRSLDGASSRLLPEEYHKDGEGWKVMLKTCKPDSKGEWVEDDATLQRLYTYCQQDVEVERKLDEVLPDWPDSEVEVWQLNERINDRGVPIDRELCEGAAYILDTTLSGLADRISEMTKGEITTGNQVLRIRKFVAERGVSMTCLDKDAVAGALEGELPEDVRDVLQLRQLTAGAAAKKFISVLGIAEEDDRARGMFMYYSAATGRFGSGKTQFHNMKKGGDRGTSFRDTVISKDMDLVGLMYGNAMVSVLGRNVRSLVCVPEGHKLLRIDASQIECRILHWLAGDEKMLDMFRAKEDPYIKFACKIFNKAMIGKDDHERAVGKAAVLGLGFGMGAVRFVGQVKEQAGVEIIERFARRVVKLYRAENALVTQLWNKYEAAAKTCVETGQTTRVGKIIFHMENEYLKVTLPSGRQLFYYKPAFRKGQRGPRFEYLGPTGIRHKWAGGLLVENIVQAIARDILVHAMLIMQDRQVPIVMHVHDEAMAQVRLHFVDGTKERMMAAMTKSPKWAAGLPLAAELKVAERYA